MEISKSEVKYVIRFSRELMTEDEKTADNKYVYGDQLSNATTDQEKLRRNFYIKIGRLKESYPTSVTELLKDGYEVFKQNVANRIINQHPTHPIFNYCPNCGKLARTPYAKQCRFCLHDWH